LTSSGRYNGVKVTLDKDSMSALFGRFLALARPHGDGTDAVEFYTRKKVLTSRWAYALCDRLPSHPKQPRPRRRRRLGFALGIAGLDPESHTSFASGLNVALLVAGAIGLAGGALSAVLLRPARAATDAADEGRRELAEVR
jgi:hypothetical protein